MNELLTQKIESTISICIILIFMIEKYKMNERNVEKNEQEIIGWMSKHSIKKNKKFSIDKKNKI